jgi:hypothetical protein
MRSRSLRETRQVVDLRLLMANVTRAEQALRQHRAKLQQAIQELATREAQGRARLPGLPAPSRS